MAKEIADEAITLLKNEDNILPIVPKKYRHIGVMGGLAENPTYMGGGSSTVHTEKQMIDSPLQCMKSMIGNQTQVEYFELFNNHEMPNRDGIRGDADAAALSLGGLKHAAFFLNFSIKRVFHLNQHQPLGVHIGLHIDPPPRRSGSQAGFQRVFQQIG